MGTGEGAGVTLVFTNTLNAVCELNAPKLPTTLPFGPWHTTAWPAHHSMASQLLSLPRAAPTPLHFLPHHPLSSTDLPHATALAHCINSTKPLDTAS